MTETTNSSLIANSSFATTIHQATHIAEFRPEVDSWSIWLERLEIHFSEINCYEENIKKAVLLKSVGSTAYGLLHSLCSPTRPVSKTFDELCTILAEHYTPPIIVFKERKIFYTAKKGESESVSQWFARVKKLAINCKFGDNLNSFVLDKFVMELPSKIFDRICEEDENITVNNALKKALIYELKFSTKGTAESETSKVNFVKKYGSKSPASSDNNNNTISKSNNHKNKVKKDKSPKCVHCGWSNHSSNNCKYKNSTCNYCSKTGHLASVCYAKNKNKNVNYVSDNYVSENFDQCHNDINFSVFSINDGRSSGTYTKKVLINGVEADAVCDTGAPCTLIPALLRNKFKINSDLKKCDTPYVDYNGYKITTLGECLVSVSYKGITKQIMVTITNTNNPLLLGRNFLRVFNFDLVQVNSIDIDTSVIESQIKKEYAEVFDGKLGLYNLSRISLPIKNNVTPIFCKPRSVPLAWKTKVEKQLINLVDNGVLEQVHNSDWGTPLVPIVKPNGDLRICADYKITINKHLLDFNYPLPRIEDIFAALEGGDLFSKLDMTCAYNQLELDDKSQKLCTWSTHIGTFKMKRLPFGVKPAAAIFQKIMESLLRDIPNVVVYQDDITVTGKDTNEHVKNLRLVLKRLLEAGLKLNLSKCEFFKRKISYLGFSIDKFGLSKNGDRTVCILNAPIPINLSQLRAFIGMVNYYSKFIPNYSKKMAPLYELLKKNKEFLWSEKCQEAYEIIKKDITSDQILAHFNPKLPIILTTDASNDAVAGVLSHEFDDGTVKPVAFVSRTLSISEKNYSTLQKEALAIIFSVTKLKQYLLGHHFILQTDHKPLITIFAENKGFPVMAAARIQRWAFILSGFNYTIRYVKGSINIADGLSRIPQLDHPNKDDLEKSYVSYIEQDNALGLCFKKIALETRRDPVLSKLSEAIQSGVVDHLNAPEFTPYKNKLSELSVEFDCILWGYRTVVPCNLRKQILNELHRSHLGVVKTKGLARSYVWWPKIDSDIEVMIKQCVPCQQLQVSPERSSLVPWTTENKVWSRIHIDFAGPISNHYLFVVIDSFSKWVEVFITKEITSSFTISKLRKLFCTFGIVDTIVSDNGRQFTSLEFKHFLQRNNVRHVLTPPGHPATNGQAENFIKTLKKSILASLKDNSRDSLDIILNRFLCDYRITCHCATGESPVKLFLGRSIKTRFSSLKPPLVKEKIHENQCKAIENHKGKRNLEFLENQKVLIRDYKDPNKPSWTPATIKEKLGPRTYSCIIQNTNKTIKRHLDQIRKQEGSLKDTENGNVIDISMQESDTHNVDKEAPESVETISADTSPPQPSKMRPNSGRLDSIKEGFSTFDVRKLRPRIDGKVVQTKQST